MRRLNPRNWPRRFRSLSFRVRIPLLVMLTILIATGVSASILIFRSFEGARTETQQSSLTIARALERQLGFSLLRDDPWAAYEMISTVGEPLPLVEQRLIILVDAKGQIFSSSQPKLYRLATMLHAAGEDGKQLANFIPAGRLPAPTFEQTAHFLALLHSVQSDDGTELGKLIVATPSALALAKFKGELSDVLMATFGVLALLFPIGWYLGNKIATPLVQLTDCMARIADGQTTIDNCGCELPDGDDELGKLAREFRSMMLQITEKQALARSMVTSERLAALGRLAAGMAHEINNPLGGMLNVIKNQRRQGGIDPAMDRSMSLLERGLAQIQRSVGALLVEARVDGHSFGPDDLEDLCTLLASPLQEKALHLDCQSSLTGPIPLPAGPVRQILLNLLLNAIKAADHQTVLLLSAAVVPGGDGNENCHLLVKNRGQPIPPERLEHLFEPFTNSEINGLGLWVTYQLVDQLSGGIRVSGDEHGTAFDIILPIPL